MSWHPRSILKSNFVKHFNMLIATTARISISVILHNQREYPIHCLLLSTRQGQKHLVFQHRRQEQGPEWAGLSLAISGLFYLILRSKGLLTLDSGLWLTMMASLSLLVGTECEEEQKQRRQPWRRRKKAGSSLQQNAHQSRMGALSQ